MFSSTNEVNGFSAVGQEELENVNGGSPFLAGLIGGIIIGLIGGAITGSVEKANKK